MSLRLFQTFSALVNVMGKAAMSASRGLVRDFGEVEHLHMSLRGPRDFVSAADRRAEQTIQRELARARPAFGFLTEASGITPGEEDMTWVVTPLDGTFNFLHGIPHFAISIGLLKEKEPIAGVVYDPLRHEIFWAEKGVGACVNDRKLRASNCRRLPEALFGASQCLSHNLSAGILGNGGLDRETGVRISGVPSLDLAYVAAGRLDGFVGKNLKPWDLVAGIAIAREAGGAVSDWNSGGAMLGTGQVLATSAHLAPLVLGCLKGGGEVTASGTSCLPHDV